MGVARFVRLAERPDTAEAAVTVIDDWQGRGVALLDLHGRPAHEAEDAVGEGARQRLVERPQVEGHPLPSAMPGPWGSSPSVRVSITRASAMPSAMWWIRTRSAQPGP